MQQAGDTLQLSFFEIAAALTAGSITLIVLGLQPILLGELVEAKSVTLEGVGFVAMAEIVALGLGVLLGDLLLPLNRVRGIVAVAALGSAAIDSATLFAAGDLCFSLVRGGAGLCEGIIIWATTAAIVRSSNPARIAGIFFVTQTMAQALLGLVLARLVIPVWSWHGAFTILAILMLLPAVLALALPATMRPLAAAAECGFRWSTRTVAPLVVVSLQMATLSSLWAYVEPLGTAVGFDAASVQTLIALGLLVQIVGGSVGSAFVSRLQAAPTLFVGTLVLGAVALGFAQIPHGAQGGFAALCFVFCFTWLFLSAYQMALSFCADPSGRIASLIPAAQVFGIALGPLVASLIIDGNDASPVPFVSASFAAAAACALYFTRSGSQSRACYSQT